MFEKIKLLFIACFFINTVCFGIYEDEESLETAFSCTRWCLTAKGKRTNFGDYAIQIYRASNGSYSAFVDGQALADIVGRQKGWCDSSEEVEQSILDYLKERLITQRQDNYSLDDARDNGAIPMELHSYVERALGQLSDIDEHIMALSAPEVPIISNSVLLDNNQYLLMYSLLNDAEDELTAAYSRNGLNYIEIDQTLLTTDKRREYRCLRYLGGRRFTAINRLDQEVALTLDKGKHRADFLNEMSINLMVKIIGCQRNIINFDINHCNLITMHGCLNSGFKDFIRSLVGKSKKDSKNAIRRGVQIELLRQSYLIEDIKEFKTLIVELQENQERHEELYNIVHSPNLYQPPECDFEQPIYQEYEGRNNHYNVQMYNQNIIKYIESRYSFIRSWKQWKLEQNARIAAAVKHIPAYEEVNHTIEKIINDLSHYDGLHYIANINRIEAGELLGLDPPAGLYM